MQSSRRWRGASIVVVVIVTLGFGGQHAAAQGTTTASSESDYDALIREALAEFNASDFAEARALFERAHALSPSARTLRGLGITAFELKRYVQALNELEAALTDQRKPLTDAQRREVEALIVRTQRFVGKVKLELVPQDASVALDGRPITGTTLMLDLGAHELSVQATGYREKQLKLVIDGSENTTQRVELSRLDLSPTHPTAAGLEPSAITRGELDSTAASDTVFAKWWFWTAVGVAVAGATVGTVLALSTTKTRIEPLTTPNTPKGAMIQAATWGP
jgi:hypothetical protein